MHVRNEKSEKRGESGGVLNLPPADACHPQPALRQPARSLAAPRSLPDFAMEPLPCSTAPPEMEKAEVATTAVTLPRSPNKVSSQPLISPHPAAPLCLAAGAGRPRSGECCWQGRGLVPTAAITLRKQLVR